MIDTYKKAMEYIDEKSRLGIVPGLDNIIELLRRLGDPQNKVKCLHIAGTNGKGSIFSFVQNVLIKNGYKIGRYVSPTILDYLERFQISDDASSRNMTKDEFVELLDIVACEAEKMVEEGLDSPTSFEIETAVAYLFFASKKVDYALIECGMGGRLDATNVIEDTFISVFASISYDHMQFLGDTLSAIANEKAGIIRENSICVSAPQKIEVSEVLRHVCEEKHTRYIEVSESDIKCLEMSELGTDFIYKNKEHKILLPGEFQLINASVAIEVLDCISKTEGKKIEIEEGLAATSWPGRFTIANQKPLTIIDGAHNEAAWKLLADTLNKHFTNNQFIFIIGVLRDKEYEKMVDILYPLMSRVIAITPDSPRGLSKEVLAEVIRAKGVCCDTSDSVDDACQKAYEWAKNDSCVKKSVMICGSLSFLKPYLEYDFGKL